MHHLLIIMKHPFLAIVTMVLAAILLLALIQYLVIRFNGTNVSAPSIPRSIQSFGSIGPELKYAVMGDSTSVGQGAQYSQSYAYASAEHLAKNRKIKLLNVGVSGAVTKDLLGSQLNKVSKYKPDIVLIGVGANDATAFTGGASLDRSLQSVIDGLKNNNPTVKIVLTGCPAMGSIDRFPNFGARQLAGLRERQVNKTFIRVIDRNDLTLAPIAQKTGPAFAADPTLFAADKFHPNDRGYSQWIPIINSALDDILES